LSRSTISSTASSSTNEDDYTDDEIDYYTIDDDDNDTDDDDYNIIGYESGLREAERKRVIAEEHYRDNDEERSQNRMRDNNAPFKQPYCRGALYFSLTSVVT
jgi:hypothetical protein